MANGQGISPPASGGSSVAAAQARQGAGLGGIYTKTESAPLVVGTGVLPDISTMVDASDGELVVDNLADAGFTAITNGVLFDFEVWVPSARIRCAFGVGKSSENSNTFSRAQKINGGLQEFVNVIPGVLINIPQGAAAADPDKSNVINGQPLYPYWRTADGLARAVFDPRDIVYGGYDGSAANSGGVATPSGTGLPFAYEAVSKAGVYRVKGMCITNTSGDKISLPLMAWASWEIIDPRDEADTVELLSKCILVTRPRPQVI